MRMVGVVASSSFNKFGWWTAILRGCFWGQSMTEDSVDEGVRTTISGDTIRGSVDILWMADFGLEEGLLFEVSITILHKHWENHKAHNSKKLVSTCVPIGIRLEGGWQKSYINLLVDFVWQRMSLGWSTRYLTEPIIQKGNDWSWSEDTGGQLMHLVLIWSRTIKHYKEAMTQLHKPL